MLGICLISVGKQGVDLSSSSPLWFKETVYRFMAMWQAASNLKWVRNPTAKDFDYKGHHSFCNIT